LRWIEVDLPDLLREKAHALAADRPVCVLERVSLDFAHAAKRRDFLQHIGSDARKALIISEGLLVYLPSTLVSDLAEDLYSQSSFRYWATDLVTPTVKQRINRSWSRQLEEAGMQYQFAPEEGTKFFWQYGWCEAEFHALFENSIRINRTPAWFWAFRLLQAFAPKCAAAITEKSRAGVVLLQKGHSTAGLSHLDSLG
jgi:O-methyltransferase involved in polyketide biosynthesis